jgi:carbon storage regulator CsrA
MLVLTRKIGESILIPSHGLSISVGTIRRGRVRLRISAPAETTILRAEVRDRQQQEEVPQHACTACTCSEHRDDL